MAQVLEEDGTTNVHFEAFQCSQQARGETLTARSCPPVWQTDRRGPLLLVGG